MCAYRILSMDGGGIRGILTARVLERLEEALPGFIESIDLFAGSSTGGLLAVGLASGRSAATMRALYQDLADEVFGKAPGPIEEFLLNIKEFVVARYPYTGLKKVLEDQFHDLKLADLQKKVLIATFQLDNGGKPPVRMWKMKFFENYPHEGSDGAESVVDVAVRTAVAPSYFPIYQGFVDGGVAAASPAMCALAQAMERNTGGQQLHNIRLLSMGTGFNPHFLTEKDADWGMAQWVSNLNILNVMLEGSTGLVDYQCRQILEDNYYRVDTPLPIPIELGDLQHIPELLDAAEKVDIGPIVDWLRNCYLLD